MGMASITLRGHIMKANEKEIKEKNAFIPRAEMLANDLTNRLVQKTGMEFEMRYNPRTKENYVHYYFTEFFHHEIDRLLTTEGLISPQRGQ